MLMCNDDSRMSEWQLGVWETFDFVHIQIALQLDDTMINPALACCKTHREQRLLLFVVCDFPPPTFALNAKLAVL